MTFPESELYAGIKTRLLDAALADHWEDNGHVAPVTIGIYNRDYEEVGEKIPYARPAVFIEINDYPTEDIGGHLKDAIALTLHIVQDIYVTGRSTDTGKETSHKDLLKYPILIRSALHNLQIDTCRLSASGMVPDHGHKNLLVHKLTMKTLTRTKPTTA